MGGVIVVGGAYAYHHKTQNNLIDTRKQAIVFAHNSFFPQEWHYHDPLTLYEHDSLTDILTHYQRDKRQQKIFYNPDPSNILAQQEISSIDYTTFTPIDQSRARDHNSLFKDWKLLLDQVHVPQLATGGVYLFNDTDVYYWREWEFGELKDIDRSSFEVMASQHYYNTLPYARDRHHVYLLDKIIPNINPQDAEILSNFYIKDRKKIVYSDGNVHRVLQWVDKASFQVVSDQEHYDAKDKKWYFYQGERVEIIEFPNHWAN